MFKWIKDIFSKSFTKANNKLFGYLNKSDFIVVITTVPISIISLLLQSISTHLDRKIERQKQLQIKPLNYLQVKFIPYEAYHMLITDRSWDAHGYMQAYNSSILHEERNVLPIDIKKNIENISKQPTIIQKNTDSLLNKANNFSKKLSGTATQYVNNLKQNTSENNKPPIEKKQKMKEIEYFIVQDSNGKIYDPNEVRRSGKKQNINYKKDKNGKYVNTLNQTHKVVGKVGGSEIEHETLKETIVNIIYSALNIKKRKTYGVVFDTRYDAYGRRIETVDTTQQNDQTKTLVNDKNISKINKDKYITKFILDGTLQQQKKSNSLQDANNANIYDINTLNLLVKLEYLFENCWIKYAKKYQNTNLSYTYQVIYDKETKKPIKVNFISKNIPEELQHMTTEMKDDIKNTILNCNIKEVEEISNHNYDFWGKIEITFSSL